jgi:hypothetical protein
MTEPSSTGKQSSAQTVFPSAEWEALQTEDRQAAKQIVLLLVSIFILGLIGYLTICFIVK